MNEAAVVTDGSEQQVRAGLLPVGGKPGLTGRPLSHVRKAAGKCLRPTSSDSFRRVKKPFRFVTQDYAL